MIALYGICNTSIYTLHCFYGALKKRLEAKGKKTPKLQILGFDSTAVKDNTVIFVPSVALFLAKRKLLNEAKVKVFVFDCAVQCEHLKPIVLLDVEQKTHSYLYQFKKIGEKDLERAVQEEGKELVVSKTTVRIIPKLINTVEKSMLSPVMKFLYCIPNPLDRNEYSLALAKWFFSDKSVEALQKKLAKMSGLTSYFALEDLITYFNSPPGKKLKAVAAEVGPKPKRAEILKIAKKHAVNEYEIMYVSSLYKKAGVTEINKTSKQIDSDLRTKYAKAA